jgi:phage shock protein A
MLQENKSLKNELEDYKQSLDEYDDIVEQLKQARIKLDSL